MTSALTPEAFYNACRKQGVDYFTGVPDSVVGPLSSYLAAEHPTAHDIAANEGNAVGLAIGHYLGTGHLPLVYLQNSGLGNALDPLTSAANPEVMHVPLLLLVGWRGQPGAKDEPQHTRPGAATQDLLEILGIPSLVLYRDPNRSLQQIAQISANARATSRVHALIVEPDTFEPYQAKNSEEYYPLSREQALHLVLEQVEPAAAYIATNGMTGRELHEYRRGLGETQRDLLVVGAMGHASSIAAGVARSHPDRRIVCLDGDGSMIMHLGALATIASQHLTNFLHIVFNNAAHDSTGGQPTAGRNIELAAVARACGYRDARTVSSVAELHQDLGELLAGDGPALLEIYVHRGHRPNLSRPTISPKANRSTFSKFINGNSS